MNIIPFPDRADGLRYWLALCSRHNRLKRPLLPFWRRFALGATRLWLSWRRNLIKSICRKADSAAVGTRCRRSQLSDELKAAIRQAYHNIRLFHERQKQPIEKIETMPGVMCWRKSVGIEKVGLYIPGGTAPLFSTVLMLGIPAQLAGCREMILCTPSNHPAIYFAAKLVGITKVFRIGGAQAIAAMAYGTESVPQVYKIFGPGNQYVTAAKMLVAKEGMAIDMPAGPSEVAVYADDSAIPAFVAADLLSQAEHGADSQVLLVSTSKKLLSSVNLTLPRN